MNYFLKGYRMDNRAIGIFDSGVGGLTAVRCLRRLLPGEDIVFFGDTARVPYGSRTPEEIHRFARENLDYLLTFGIKAALVACGTISAIALDDLQNDGIPVCGVLIPAVEQAVRLTRNRRVGVIATPASIGSGSYQRALEARGFPYYVPSDQGQEERLRERRKGRKAVDHQQAFQFQRHKKSHLYKKRRLCSSQTQTPYFLSSFQQNLH